MFKDFHIKNFDFILFILVILLTIFGIISIGAVDESLMSRQIFGASLGFVLMLILTFLDYKFILNFYWVIYIFNILLLSTIFTPLGASEGGARRWIAIGGLQFQPSELTKILLILFFAKFIIVLGKNINTFRGIFCCMILMGIPAALVFKQPDLSTTIVLLVIFCAIMFVGNLSFKFIFGVLIVCIPVIIVLFSIAMDPDSDILERYQKNRILSFLNPQEYALEEAYQQLNSVTAIASGQLDGKGYRNNEITSVKNGDFLSEEETDFIFAIIGEEFGFKGTLTVILLIFAIAVDCLIVAVRAPDLPGRIIAASVGTMFGFQGFFNMGVATFILPNTGLPLPFVSYGLTSLVSSFIGIGLVINIRFQAVKLSNIQKFDDIDFKEIEKHFYANDEHLK